MSTISAGWSSSSIISDVLPEEEFDDEEDDDNDELVLTDNERLRGRVEELEKIVLMQRNEIMLLQSSTVEILRRLQNLELNSQSRKSESLSSMGYNSLPRSVTARISGSKSTYSMTPVAPPPLPRHHHHYKDLMTKNGGGGMNNNEEIINPPVLPRRSSTRGADMVNVSVGKSARGSPMRKWVSTTDFKENMDRRLSTSSEASTSATMNPIVNSVRRMSTTNRQSSPSLLSLCSIVSRSPSTSSVFLRKNAKTCQISEKSGNLPIFLNGKSVQVPVPTGFENIDPTADQPPPSVQATLKHVYSYRGKDVRSNVEMLPTGELVFFSANLVILMNLNGEERVQRIYYGHTSDVKCISLHPNKILLASGQSSCHSIEKSLKLEHLSPINSTEELVKQLDSENTEAHVRIWDTIKLTTLIVLNGFEKGISCISFSFTDSGTHLGVVDDSLKHLMSVWNWQKGQRIGEVKAANDTVFDMKWHPTIRNLLVLYGKGHFSFFTFDPSTGILIKSIATFEGRDKPKTVLSLCFAENGNVVTGDSNGTISIWDPKTYKTIKQAHSVHPGGVYSLTIGKSGKLLSGGKDRMISEWDVNDLIRAKRPIELPDEKGIPRVILQSGTDLIVGTSSNCLLRANPDTNPGGFSTLIEGDPGELTGLLVCGSHQLVTTSQCGTVRIWNTREKRVEWSKKYMDGVECVDLDGTSTHLILGFTGGVWHVVNVVKQTTIEEKREGSVPVTAVKFTPTGSTFAVATKDPSLTIYRIDASKNLLVMSRIHHLPSPLTSIDFSIDSQHLRAQSTGAHLLFWTKTGEICDGSGVRDVKWASSRVKIGFETALVAHSSNNQLTSVSLTEDLIATGMENGTVRIYQNPVTSVSAGFVELLGHGKSIKSVCFGEKSQLFTCSPTDNSIFEWSLE